MTGIQEQVCFLSTYFCFLFVLWLLLLFLIKFSDLLDNPKDVISVYLGLVDILFAYSYDVRTTEGEKTVSVQHILFNICEKCPIYGCLYSIVHQISFAAISVWNFSLSSLHTRLENRPKEMGLKLQS